MEISNLNIVITGGASGFGKAMAEHLMTKAAKIIIIDINKEALDSVTAQADNLYGYVADLTDYSAVGAVVKQIFDDHGKVNVLVNNAGIIHSEPLVNLLSKDDRKHSLENWQRTIDINLNAVFYITSHIAEQMVMNRNKGVIINISSISSFGNPGQSAYSATKGALNALSVTWAKELGMFGIRSNAIAPGFFDTASTSDALNENKIKTYTKATPVGRMGKPQELAHAIEFIIANDFYNGHIMRLDGGLTL